jgi:hypothetical protein
MGKDKEKVLAGSKPKKSAVSKDPKKVLVGEKPKKKP